MGLTRDNIYALRKAYILSLDLLNTDEVVHVAEDIQQSDAIKKEVHTILVRIEQLTSTTGPAHRPAAATISSSSVKLPKLMITPFRGDKTKWMTFWDFIVERC